MLKHAGNNMLERVLGSINRTMALVEMWDDDPTINGTKELYALLEEARTMAQECYHTHDTMEEYD